MAARFGTALATYLVLSQCTGKVIQQQLNGLRVSYRANTSVEEISSALETPSKEENARMYAENMKTALTRIIKSYRAVKPEITMAMCFSRYAGIIGSDRKNGRALKNKELEKDEVAFKALLRDVVHAFMLFMTDITPDPVLRMMDMAMDMYHTTRNMYKAMKQDEMGSCSLEYMSKRFWWWIGI